MIFRTLATTAIALSLFAGSSIAGDADTGHGPYLEKTEDGTYVAPRALEDFTDYILVHTEAGKIEPHLMTIESVADALVDYDVIFFGEVHRHPANHLAQMKMFAALHRRFPDMTLSLEQFERDTQQVVDDYLAGKIGEEVLKDKGRAWDNYLTSYRPLVEHARKNGLPVIAAETPKSLVVCYGKYGAAAYDMFTDEQKGWVAKDLHLHDGPYKDKYMRFAGGSSTHGGGSHGEQSEADKAAQLEKAFRSFTAQVARDDTMAEAIYLHLQANPGRKVMHLDGNFHSESFLGTAERLKIRNPDLKIAVINPVQIEGSEGATYKADRNPTGNFLLLISKSPKMFVDMANMGPWAEKVRTDRKKSACTL